MITEADAQELMDAVRAGQTDWVNGTFNPLFDVSEGTIFPPMGGGAIGGPGLSDLSAAMAARFHDGRAEVEFAQTIVAGDVVCLVAVERNVVCFDDQTEPRRWDLRATMIFRRDGDKWTMLHRHADPCLQHRGLEDTLALMDGS